jgi:hypothetical protein
MDAPLIQKMIWYDNSLVRRSPIVMLSADPGKARAEISHLPQSPEPNREPMTPTI